MILTLEETAAYLDITPDELLLSFHRGLPPGNLGWREPILDQLVWKTEDLLPPPNRCDECGFQAKTRGGLATHRRTHG